MGTNDSERWLLPAGVEEVLPPRAYQLEGMRRTALDVFDTWGYELVMPPFVEYVDSLLAGVGADLELQTFKVIDQATGRSMGVRADMTPQVARIDAHHLAQDGVPVRLCYAGTVLHARPEPPVGSRSPLQIGAELYGHDGVDSDLETLALAMTMLVALAVKDVHFDVGHYGVYRAMMAAVTLDPNEELALFLALQRKAPGDIVQALQATACDISTTHVDAFVALAQLYGSRDILVQARNTIAKDVPALNAPLDELERLADGVAKRLPNIPVNFDLAELRGYRYHAGVVFAGFAPGFGQEVLRGGRYDQAAEVFGRPRPATGFSADLRVLMALAQAPSGDGLRGIFAPCEDDPALRQIIDDLRAQGERVVQALSGQTDQADGFRCDRKLEKQSLGWTVVRNILGKVNG
jgi:ATP phosphoribosyltransferase regulatory subunit